MRLDQLELAITDGKQHELWSDIIEVIQRGDMPPEDEKQPEPIARQAFLKKVIPALARYENEQSPVDKRFLRLSNTQIANSLQSLLNTPVDIAPYLVEDPVNKHGYSMQSDFEFSGGYFNLYLPKLEELVTSAVPDLIANPEKPQQFAFTGNEWEKQHYLARRDVIKSAGGKLRYAGPNWIGDDFNVPLPPKHEYRMTILDNRPEGQFRLRIKLRNMPPTEGGEITPQELTAFLCTGILRPYGPPVGTITVPPKDGVQVFDFFGDVRDWVGVGSGKIENPRRELFKTRTLTLQNNGKLTGVPLPPRMVREKRSKTEPDRTGEALLIRQGDIWRSLGLKPGKDAQLSYSSAGKWGPYSPKRAGGKGYKPPVYRDAMKTHGWLQIESVEFELPFIETWPPKVTQSFMDEGTLNPESMADKLKFFARKAWRRPLSAEEEAYLEDLMQSQLQAFPDNPHLALKDALITVLADPKFLHLTSYGMTIQQKNHELVSRLAFFLWDGPPDDELFKLAAQDAPVSDAQLLAQVDRLLADPKSERFAENFAALWFDFKRFDQTAIDPVFFPKWSITMRKQFKGEGVAFFKELLRNDLSCLNIIDSDFIMANRVLADHYDIEDVHSYGFTRMPAPEGRGGALGMG
ncbi:MAG: DUF1592 domain-containing protein, partial [Rhizobiaceae bacterium]